MYNDKVNSPLIKTWLGQEVGTDDMTRHDKWLCMMVPRLKLLRELLSDDGVIFISIDDNEVHNLRAICDEIFGEEGFVTSIHVEMSTTQGMKVKVAKEGNLVKNAEYILAYSKDGHKKIGNNPLLNPTSYDNHYSLFMQKLEDLVFKVIPLSDKIRGNEKIIEELLFLKIIKSKNDRIDLQKGYSFSPALREFIRDNAQYIVRTHDTIDLPSEFKQQVTDSLVHVYENNSRQYLVSRDDNGNFYQKIRLSDKLKIADDFFNTFGPTTIRGDWWSGFYLDMGNVNKEGGVEFKNGKKPIRLIKQIVQFAAPENSIILDSFAGSGTTMHAVMALNKEDGGRRKCIMVQMTEATAAEADKNICRDITRERG